MKFPTFQSAIFTLAIASMAAENIPPSACKAGLSYEIEADFIYWYAKENGNEYVQPYTLQIKLDDNMMMTDSHWNRK